MIIEALLSIVLAVSQETARARGFAQLYTAVRTPAKQSIANNADQAFEDQGATGPVPPTLLYHPRILWRPRFFGGFGGPSRLGGNVTGDYTRPIGRSREAPAMPPSTTPVYLILGDQAFRRGNVDRARKAYEQAVALDPDSPFTRLALAEVEFAQQEFDPAGQLVLDALRADPGALQNTIDRSTYYP